MAVVFVIHAPEDSPFFERLTNHARAAKLPIEFDHMQMKLASVPNWKEQCRARIYRSSGAIVLRSQHTEQGAIDWELQCAQAFSTPSLEALTSEWNWPRIAGFLQSLTKGSSAYA